ncbi:hypothetical protein MPSEU_001106000 [Mayamaea pseudoterrestris]|nr:hypothetical protein MPSEU_001106000 [Mayamaea pseudoterrestris]
MKNASIYLSLDGATWIHTHSLLVLTLDNVRNNHHYKQSDGSHHTIVLKAMGRAINKAVTICEIIKRKLPVHQLHELSSVEMTDVYAPLEEGLDQVVSKRHVSCMRILLSLSSENMDINHYGYQPPLSQYEMQQQQYAPMQHHAAQYPPLPAQQQQHYYVAPHV